MASPPPSVLFIMADYGHDPTETAVPYEAFRKAGFSITFATENGAKPSCDAKMLTGITQKLLGANQAAISSYNTMATNPDFNNPISWSAPSFSLDSYSLVFLPGGHEKGVRQVIDSPIIQKALAGYFLQTRKPSTKSVAAICHGVLGLSEATSANGKSVLHDATTTALPGMMEQGIFWGTRLFLGDYYKTYGAGSDSVEVAVKSKLDNPGKQWKGSLAPTPFVVEDEKYNYVSGRFPPDAQLLAEKAIALVKKGQTAN